MSNGWISKIPSSLSAKDCERGNVVALGGEPPIRIVPAFSDEKAESTVKPETCIIKLVGDTKDTYQKYDGGEPEEALIHVRLYTEVLDRKGCKSHWATAKLQIQSLQAEKAALIDPDDPQHDVLNTSIAEARKAKKDAMAEAWQLFERLLNTRLVAPWQQIARKAQTQNPYIDGNGKKVVGTRGKSWMALTAAIRMWLVGTPMEENAAERHRRYMAVQIRMPTRVIKVRVFIDRVREMNEYFQFLPSQKEVEGAPDELKNGKVPFTQIELCELVLMAVPYNLSSAYWAKQKKGHYPMDLDALTDELVSLEPEFNRLQSLLDAKKKEDAKGKAKKSDEKPSAAKKSQHGKHQKPGGGWANKQKCLCQRCAQWSPQVKFTHNTDKCLKWEKDGTPKNGGRIPRKQAHALTRSDSFEEMKKSYATLSKGLESINRKLERRSRKRSHRDRKRAESDYSSDDSY